MSGAADQIKRMRLAAKVATNKDLAAKIDEKQTTISSWKNRGVPDPKIYQIAGVLGCSVEWLRTGKGEMRPPQVQEEAPDWIHYQHERERQLIKLFRRLHPAEQDKVIEIAQLYAGAKEPRTEKGGGSGLKESNSK